MERAPLILRHQIEETYRVWYEDKCVGTIAWYNSGPQPFWEWSISKLQTTPYTRQYGTAARKDLAMKAFRKAFDAILAGPHDWMPDPPKWTPFRKEGST